MKKKINDFTDLEVYNLSVDLAREIYSLTSRFPSEEKFGVTNQLRRATSSVGANTAEGFGRFHKKDFIRFLYNSRGSLYETQHFLILSNKLDYLNSNKLKEFNIKIKNLGIKLNNLISSIYSSKFDN